MGCVARRWAAGGAGAAGKRDFCDARQVEGVGAGGPFLAPTNDPVVGGLAGWLVHGGA